MSRFHTEGEMLKAGFPFFLIRAITDQRKNVKTSEDNLDQRGECKLCFCMHKNLFILPCGANAHSPKTK